MARKKYGTEWAGLDKRRLVAYMISKEVFREVTEPDEVERRRRENAGRVVLAAALARDMGAAVRAVARAAESFVEFAGAFGEVYEALAAKLTGDAARGPARRLKRRLGGGRTGG